MAAPDTVFFLSDYGVVDEFVGVVHAVVRRLAPHAAVIDLTHQVAPFDVRGGALTLARAAPHLGPGVVLAVVDPGVGGPRRAVVLEAAGGRLLVGPDNGLLLPAVRVAGGVRRAVVLPPGGPGTAATFDGRDVLAPAAAALCRGAAPSDLGEPCDPAGLVALAPGVVEHGRGPDGRRVVRAEVTWVDRFGNVQLAATAAELAPAGPGHDGDGRGAPSTDALTVVDPRGGRTPARRVRAFAEISPDELGLLVDANGHLALVRCRSSAAQGLGLSAGDLVELRL